MSLKRMRS